MLSVLESLKQTWTTIFYPSLLFKEILRISNKAWSCDQVKKARKSSVSRKLAKGGKDRVLELLQSWKCEVTPAERCWRTRSCCWTRTRLVAERWSFFTRRAGASAAWIGRATGEANRRRGRTSIGSRTPRWSLSWRVFWRVARRRGTTPSRGDRAAPARPTVNRANWIKPPGTTRAGSLYRDRGWLYRFTPTPGDDEPALLRLQGGDTYAKVFQRDIFFFFFNPLRNCVFLLGDVIFVDGVCLLFLGRFFWGREISLLLVVHRILLY